MSPRFLPAGERGLVVEFGNAVSLEINARVRALALGLEAARIPGLIEVIPTYRSLGIAYDPQATSCDELQARVREVMSRLDPGALPAPKLVRIPTVYGGPYGPDLPFVAEHAGLGEAEVIRLHSEPLYHVYMIGFTAGFAYLGGLPERLHTPRLSSPRIKTPKGSVAVGGSQTGAYPAETPGGWRIIGRTFLELFDPSREVPTPMVPGDRVQFVPITEQEYLARIIHESPQTPPPRTPWVPSPIEGEGHTSGSPLPTVGEGQGEGADARHEASSRIIRVKSREPRAESGGMKEIDQGSTRLSIEVLRPGLLTTVQDRGRIGYQKFGVPVSGAVDEVALRVGNILVGNPQGAAGLELTALGPQLRFLDGAVVALSGAEVEGDLDGRRVPWYQSFLVRAGQVLDLRTCARGLRAYLAMAGGIDVPSLLGSRSTCLVAGFGGFRGRALLAGDVLRVGAPPALPGDLCGRGVPEKWRPRDTSPATIRVVLGPQDGAFTAEGCRTFLESIYRVSPHADRMGSRLDGPLIAHRASADLISDWVPLGGIQVPGDGKPIILLADRQTTGGYPKIATVIGPDVPLAAQRRPGDLLRFRAVSVADGRAVARDLEAGLLALPGRLVSAESWTYAAGLGEVPGEIPLATPEGPSRDDSSPPGPIGGAPVRSPLAALVAKVLVRPGGTVAAGEALCVLQAMKMEIEVPAPRAGRITGVSVREGDSVAAGDLLVAIEPVPSHRNGASGAGS